MVKRESESERVASDTKTARLRALRLAKEAAAAEEPFRETSPARKRMRRFT
jgi:hypothetical protein